MTQISGNVEQDFLHKSFRSPSVPGRVDVFVVCVIGRRDVCAGWSPSFDHPGPLFLFIAIQISCLNSFAKQTKHFTFIK